MTDKTIAPMTNLDRLIFSLDLSSGGPISVDFATLHAVLRMLGHSGIVEVFRSEEDARKWLDRAFEEPKP